MFRGCLRDKCRREPTAEQMGRLGGIGCLTPGDFKVVAQKHFCHGPVAVDTLLEDLRKEAAPKREDGRRIGF